MTPASPPTGGPLPRVVVVGLGPAGPSLVGATARALAGGGTPCFLRTGRHPAAAVLSGTPTFDHLYERHATFEAVYGAIVEHLVEAAGEHGTVVYAVPGSPAVGEATVRLLQLDGRIETEVHPALSFLDLVWNALAVDPLEAGARLVDGSDFAVAAASQRGPFVVAQCWSKEILSAIKLALVAAGGPGGRVTVLHHLGLPGQVVEEMAWDELDRLDPDHLTTLWVPRLAAPVASELTSLWELVRTLRQRCPWDREQTHQSLTRHLLEESYEVLEAIDELDPSSPATFAHLEEELGDLLFQVCFHSALAAEEGQFELADVARGVHDKLVGRHPHVFASVQADTPGEVMANWEQLKAKEKGRTSIMDGISDAMPSLLAAQKVLRKAATVGLAGQPEEPGALSEAERLSDPAGLSEAEVGARLLAVVRLAGGAGIDAEAALRHATGSFRRRFMEAERLAAEAGRTLADLDAPAVAAIWRRSR